MLSTSIACGALLILLGVIGYIYGLTQNAASLTALIPALFGIVLVILGFLSKTKENLRKHLMHAAVLIALIGFIMTAGRLLSKIGSLALSAAAISQLLMALICLAFVILSVKSFIDARKTEG
ncbi:MAG TPA: hypothetical protein VGC76_07010 [Pyrinomonadaceae bacterium]|jgi:hypothetical protein